VIPIVQFDPQLVPGQMLPDAGTPQAIDTTVHLQGSFLMHVQYPPGPIKPALLAVSYDLTVQLHENITPADAPGLSGSVQVSFALAGRLTGVLWPPSPVIPAAALSSPVPWQVDAAIHSQGSMTGSWATSTDMKQVIDAAFTSNTSIDQTEAPLGTPAGAWAVHIGIDTAGQLSEVWSALGLPTSIAAALSTTEAITATLAPRYPPTPIMPTEIDATFAAVGVLGELQYPPNPIIGTQVLSGAWQLSGRLTGTITPPASSGPAVSLDTNVLEIGAFVEAATPIGT
jgi:hypothetical protein